MRRGYDVRTKLMFLLVANLFLLVNPGLILLWTLIILFSLDFIWQKTYWRLGLYWAFFTIATLAVNADLNESKHPYLGFFLLGGLTVLPCFMVGLSILRTPVHEFIQSLRKWHIPESILIVFGVAMRFLPTLKQSYCNILDALKLRGEFVYVYQYLLHPLGYFEKILIPLLLNASQLGQDLTIAALTKAIGSKQKTSYIDYSFTFKDYFAWFSLSLLVVTYLARIL